jgi:hypothetical protein
MDMKSFPCNVLTAEARLLIISFDPSKALGASEERSPAIDLEKNIIMIETKTTRVVRE